MLSAAPVPSHEEALDTELSTEAPPSKTDREVDLELDRGVAPAALLLGRQAPVERSSPKKHVTSPPSCQGEWSSSGLSTPTPRSRLVLAWGALGVTSYLAFGVWKVIPIVVHGLPSVQTLGDRLLLLAAVLFFAYAEGYRGFQKNFAPRVVARAWVVSEVSPSLPVWHKLLAPAFCIGYFHAVRRRVIASWAVTTVIVLVVLGVKRLPDPYRAIIDAGVVVGLVWGVASVLLILLGSLRRGAAPEFDPALPAGTPYSATTCVENIALGPLGHAQN